MDTESGSPIPRAIPAPDAPIKEWAEYYGEMGYQIFPCRGKVPLIADWPNAASSEYFQIKEWWEQRYPDANIGCLCGVGDFTVDIDPRNGGDDTLRALEKQHGELPRTLTAYSGGRDKGQHLTYGLPVGLRVINKKPIGNGLDVLGRGAQVILPPSIHPDTGNPYTWEPDYGPGDIAPQQAPEWLLKMVTGTQRQEAGTAEPAERLAPVQSPIPQGKRNQTLYDYGAAMAELSMPYAAIKPALDAMNQFCVPPLPEWEVERTARSAAERQLPRLKVGTNGHRQDPWGTPMPTPPPLGTTPLGPVVPPLPFYAQCPPTQVCGFLRAYVEHSQRWAPRAAPDFHSAVGMWVLSTIAARRIVVHMGATEVFPTLFLALVAESTLWTKTTAAALGVRLVKRAGCEFLLGPDRTTPQFMLKQMKGIVPEHYGNQTAAIQETMQRNFGFSSKRGWFYEEWGGMLHQMRRTDSPQSELNKLLIVLEGGQQSFEVGTIQRGLERIEKPYLALLANATPHDLLPFMQEDDAWWHDGFWPRFAFVTAPTDTAPSTAMRPRDKHYDEPSALVLQLHNWHLRLGLPEVVIEEEKEANGKRTGDWEGRVKNFPCNVIELDDDVYTAYETYNKALFELMTTTNAEASIRADLRPWYGRAHEKALRVAMLLASVDNQDLLTLPYWQEAQTLVETWRENLHTLLHDIGDRGDAPEKSRRLSRLEHRIVSLLALNGGMTARNLQRHFFGTTSEELNTLLKNMCQIEAIERCQNGRKIWYRIFDDGQ